ncbi:MAG: hypothetical protein WB988_15130, partial [Candidatus Nitrosopolaris sp.]
MKNTTSTMFTLAILSVLIIFVATNSPESMFPRTNKTSAPTAIGASNSTGGNMTVGTPTASTTPIKTDTFFANGIISSLVFVTQNPGNTISKDNNAAGIT